MVKKAKGIFSIKREPVKKRTSIGNHPSRSRPKNKYQKRCWKKYRGQGK
tara:strand:+ start:294 stop:440 length:147 start_codon:yes stop_codon:yes gene_type:complete